MVLVIKSHRAPSIQHKKRSGLHHKQNERYHKPYWPYLPLLAIVGLGIIANGVWTQRSQTVLGDTTGISASQLLVDTNAQRTADHKNALALNSQLSAAAQAKANDMVARNYWSHTTPDGKTPWSFMTTAGYQYQIAGENLAYGFNTTNSLINGWMNSAEHRANILNNNYTNIGFGIAESPNFQGSGPETVVVAMYAEPLTQTTSGTAKVLGSQTSRSVAVVSQPAAAKVSRLQTLSSSVPVSIVAVSVASIVAVLWFVLRHGLILRRTLVQGEVFVVRHRLFDIIVVCLATLGFILTRTAGVVH